MTKILFCTFAGIVLVIREIDCSASDFAMKKNVFVFMKANLELFKLETLTLKAF